MNFFYIVMFLYLIWILYGVFDKSLDGKTIDNSFHLVKRFQSAKKRLSSLRKKIKQSKTESPT